MTTIDLRIDRARAKTPEFQRDIRQQWADPKVRHVVAPIMQERENSSYNKDVITRHVKSMTPLDFLTYEIAREVFRAESVPGKSHFQRLVHQGKLPFEYRKIVDRLGKTRQRTVIPTQALIDYVAKHASCFPSLSRELQLI